MAQADRDARAQVNREREEAHQESQRREAQRERAQQKGESKRIKSREAEKKKKGGKGASGWVPIAMRDDNGLVIYDQSGRPRYHPHNEPPDGQATKKKKPPPRCPTSPPPPTTPTSGRTPMRDDSGLRLYDHSGHPRYLPQDESQDGPTTTPTATSTPATRRSTRTRNTPQRLADYIHGAEYDSDNLGLDAIPDYEQEDLRTRLDQSRDRIERRIQEQAELRARSVREQAGLQKRLSKGPRDRSPRED
jgi:hypothetical protein